MQLGVIIWVQTSEFGPTARRMDGSQVEVKMQQSSWMALCDFMLVGMKRGRFHKGQQKYNARKDGSDWPHGNFLISQCNEGCSMRSQAG